jgi:hypothetical protein
MNLDRQGDENVPRRVRICRPAMQDMHYLVMPRLTARAQLRRHAMKLKFWRRGNRVVGDLEFFQIQNEELFVVRVTDGFGLAEGFHVVFCELPFPEPDGTLCLLSVMRNDEPFTPATLDVLSGRAVIASERLIRIE